MMSTTDFSKFTGRHLRQTNYSKLTSAVTQFKTHEVMDVIHSADAALRTPGNLPSSPKDIGELEKKLMIQSARLVCKQLLSRATKVRVVAVADFAFASSSV